MVALFLNALACQHASMIQEEFLLRSTFVDEQCAGQLKLGASKRRLVHTWNMEWTYIHSALASTHSASKRINTKLQCHSKSNVTLQTLTGMSMSCVWSAQAM
jgi:hypothetical protein